MSTIKVNKIENTATADGGIAIDASGHVQIDGQQLPTAGALSNRRLNENGAMQISQRATSFSFAHDGTTTAYTLDRMSFVTANLESFDGTVTQSTDAPAGFANSWKLTTGTAEAAIDANDIAYLQLPLEAQNLQLLQYGTSSAQTVTLSFYVKSSVTGTYGCSFYQADAVRNRTATYTINTADTWEYKTITLTGDTSGTINNDNGIGFQVAWNLATGSDWDATDSTSWGAYVTGRWGYGHAQDGVITTAGATWFLTGVQLEVGEKATPFEHRSYGDELIKCERYFELMQANNNVVTGYSFTTSGAAVGLRFRTVKRAAPGTITLATAGQSVGQLTFLTSGGSYPSSTGSNAVDSITVDGFRVNSSGYSGLTNQGVAILYITGPGTVAKVDAEL